MDATDLEQGLRAMLREMEPYLPDLVLIGGWVPYLYRHYGPFGEWSGRDTLTRELDVLVGRPLPDEGRPPLATLLTEARFRATTPAVWMRDVEAGEQIEFLTSHLGVARGSGIPVPLAGQPGLSAIPLPGLEILREDTQLLRLPPHGEHGPGVEVRVPTLGAYIINKAATFMQRGGRQDDDGQPKIAKDLLYLRDLLAAPARVVDGIEEEVERIADGSRSHAEMVRTGANHLGLVLADPSHALLRAVARIVAERDRSPSRDEAQVRTAGYLTDLHEILDEAARRHTK